NCPMQLPQNEMIELSGRTREWPSSNQNSSLRRWGFVLFMLVLLGCFGGRLYALLGFAAHSGFYSYILLVPFISFYLIWRKRNKLTLESKPIRALALVSHIVGVGMVALGFLSKANGGLQPLNHLVSNTLACLAFFWGSCLLFFGVVTLRAIA